MGSKFSTCCWWYSCLKFVQRSRLWMGKIPSLCYNPAVLSHDQCTDKIACSCFHGEHKFRDTFVQSALPFDRNQQPASENLFHKWQQRQSLKLEKLFKVTCLLFIDDHSRIDIKNIIFDHIIDKLCSWTFKTESHS